MGDHKRDVKPAELMLTDGMRDQKWLPQYIVPQRGISSDMNILFLAVLHEIVLRKLRMRLNLVNSRYNARCGDDTLERGDGEIGYPDGPDFTSLLEVDEGFPGVDEGCFHIKGIPAWLVRVLGK